MAQIFLAFLLTSLVGTGLALVLTLLKPITRKKFSAWWHYYIWLCVLIVMMLPIRLNIPQKTEAFPIATETIVGTANQIPDFNAPVVSDIGQEIITQDTPKTSVFQTVKDFISSKLDVIGFIWIVGAVLIFFMKILSYIIFLLKIRRNSEIISCPELKNYTNRKVKTRISDTICSPLIIGVFKPTLLLPKREITKQQLHNVLAHETTHLKRNDILYKWIVAICKCVHWFNPAIYFISREIIVNCEISCDLQVVKDMDEQAEKDYIETILALLSNNNQKAVPLTTGMTGNKKTLKKRFIMIKNKRRFKKVTTVISIVLAISILLIVGFASGILNGLFVDEKIDDITKDVERTDGTVELTEDSDAGINSIDLNSEKNIKISFSDTIPIGAPPHKETKEASVASSITSIPAKVTGDDIGFAQIVLEKDTSIKDLETDFKKVRRIYTISDYSYKDNCNSTRTNIACDENGNISLFFDINAENLVDVTFLDSITKKEVAKFGILANDVNVYSFTGFDKNKTYDVAVQGKTGNNWQIEGQYIIF